MNPSDDAKKRFQEVSEAYATLGTPANRKTYDRQASASSASSSYSGYGDNVGTGGGFYYDADDNVNRRARATYAWDYQRRRRAAEQAASSSASSPFGRAGQSTGGFSDASNDAFETLAAQQRAREARNRARQTGSEAASMEDKLYQADVANPLIRFGQVVALLYIVYKAGTFFVGPNSAAQQPNGRANRRG